MCPVFASTKRARRIHSSVPFAFRFGVVSYAGTAVLRRGLKKGNFTTVAVVFNRRASIVNSICSLVPGLECAVSTLAKAINFLRSGENVVVVAFPTCLSPT